MKKAFLMMLFVFSVVIAGCGEQKAEVPADPNADNITNEMEASTETPEDPGEGEGENSSDG